MLKTSKIINLFKVFRQPIGLAFLGLLGIYSIVDVDERNKTILEDWNRMLSVQLADLSGEEKNLLRRFAPSEAIAMRFERLPIALRKLTSLNRLQLPPTDDLLIDSASEKADKSSEGLPVKLTPQFSSKEEQLSQEKLPQPQKTQQSASNKALTLEENQTLPSQNSNQESQTELELDMMVPIANEVQITSKFGWRLHPVFGNRSHFHSGIDFGGTTGTPVLAAYSGKVEKAGWQSGYGLTVILEHHEGTSKTLYAHLSKILVKKGESVQPGDAIGHVGSTGYSTGPHLHFELSELTKDGWKTIDPTPRIEAAIAHYQKEQQRAWLEQTILAGEKEFYTWVAEFTKQFGHFTQKR